MSNTNNLLSYAKKGLLSAASYPLIRQGFSPEPARQWVRSRAHDLRSLDGLPELERTLKLHRRGHIRRTAGVATDGNYSYRDYLRLLPLNEPSPWLFSRLAAYRQQPELARKHMPTPFCTISAQRDVLEIVRLANYPSHLPGDLNGLLELIKEKGSVRIQPIRWHQGLGRLLQFRSGSFLIDGVGASVDQIRTLFRQISADSRSLITDASAVPNYLTESNPKLLRLHFGRAFDGAIQVLQADLLARDRWLPRKANESLRVGLISKGNELHRKNLGLGERRFSRVQRLALTANTLQLGAGKRVRPVRIAEQFISSLSLDVYPFTFLAVDLHISSQEEFEVVDVISEPVYPSELGFSEEAAHFLAEQATRSASVFTQRANNYAIGQRVSRRAAGLRKKIEAFQLRSKGFSGRGAYTWLEQRPQGVLTENSKWHANSRQAAELGFNSGYATRFGITGSNADQFLSLRDYLYIQPLNGKYAKWVQDRVSAQSVFKPFNDSFESLHYQILLRDSEVHVIALSEQAKSYGSDIKSIGEFLKAGHKLEMASSAWNDATPATLEFVGGEFSIKGETYTPDEFMLLIYDHMDNESCVLYEAIRGNEQLNNLSSSGNTTLRVVMLNEQGLNPRVVDAYAEAVESPVDQELLIAEGTLIDRGESEFGSEPTNERQGNSSSESFNSKFLPQNHAPGMVIKGSLHSESNSSGSSLGGDDIVLVSRIDTLTGKITQTRALVKGVLYSFARHPINGVSYDQKVDHWEQIEELLTSLGRFAPQLRLIEFQIEMTANGPVITGISATPKYRQEFVPAQAIIEFVNSEAQKKKLHSSPVSIAINRWFLQVKLRTRKEFAKAFYPAGLVPYQSIRWFGDVGRDLFQMNQIPLRTKIWSYKNGFLSYRIPQYGITSHNREEFISDFEYRWLRHINKKYKYWLEDKISIKYVAAEFNDCLPAYYFYIDSNRGSNIVVPMMDCPDGYGASFEELLRLVRDKGVVALKPEEGSHGDGFYRLEYSSMGFTLNGQPATERRVRSILQNATSRYLVTEYIQMHPVLAEIYPHSVNTIRMIVFKKDGVTPQLGNAYLRIGSSKSGFVDNTAAGGMLATIDPETGVFGDSQLLENGVISKCPRHPDTGVLIAGTIPHWEYAVNKVLEISASMPQLEYLGFDLAITPDGIKLPEINRSPDFPRIDKLTPDTIDYLLYKLEKKKRIYGYDVNPPRKLVTLPKRSEK